MTNKYSVLDNALGMCTTNNSLSTRVRSTVLTPHNNIMNHAPPPMPSAVLTASPYQPLESEIALRPPDADAVVDP